jgi:hypothetical protein
VSLDRAYLLTAGAVRESCSTCGQVKQASVRSLARSLENLPSNPRFAGSADLGRFAYWSMRRVDGVVHASKRHEAVRNRCVGQSVRLCCGLDGRVDLDRHGYPRWVSVGRKARSKSTTTMGLASIVLHASMTHEERKTYDSCQSYMHSQHNHSPLATATLTRPHASVQLADPQPCSTRPAGRDRWRKSISQAFACTGGSSSVGMVRI